MSEGRGCACMPWLVDDGIREGWYGERGHDGTRGEEEILWEGGLNCGGMGAGIG
jgi:hypothetical protein